jgi:hypothetical protein
MRIINAGLKVDVVMFNIDEFSLKGDPFLYEYIPDLIIENLADNSASDFIIKLSRSNYNSFDIDDNIISIQCSDKCSVKDIITLLDYGLEYCRQSKEIYCLHGSAVVRDNLAIIFLGQVSGLGKTSIALELALNHGFSFLGDEKILLKYVGNKFSIKSTNRLKFNKSYLKDHLEVNEEGFIQKFGDISKAWYELSLLIQPQICPSGELLYDKFDSFKAEFHLYEEMTRKIRGCSRRVNDFTEPLLSIDTYKLSKKRSDFCKKLSSAVDSYHVVGDKMVAGDFLDNLLTTNVKLDRTISKK